MSNVFIGITTTQNREDARRLADEAVNQKLAACVQIEGPIESRYEWKGKVEQDEEYRVSFKHDGSVSARLTAWLLREHPYETPQWIVVEAIQASEGYASWIREQCGS